VGDRLSSAGQPIPERRKISRLADGKIGGPADDASAPAPYPRTGQQSKEDTMIARTQDRLFAACGIAFVALELGGVAIGGKTHHLTVSSSATQVANALAKPATTLSWVGGYLELLSFGFFLAFAVWASGKLGGGLLGQIARAAGTSYATLSVASLAVIDAISYRAGHGINVQLGRALVSVNGALYVGSWFLIAFFLLAAGASALGSARRRLGWSAIAIALFTLVGTAVSVTGVGQFGILLFFVWIVWASVSLSRRTPVAAGAAAIAQHA
jgi:hypothetical protein